MLGTLGGGAGRWSNGKCRMNGYSIAQYQLLVWGLAGVKIGLRGLRESIKSFHLADEKQEKSVLEAFRRATSHNSNDLGELRGKLLGAWKEGSGSGTLTYSTVSQATYSFTDNHTFTYTSETTSTMSTPFPYSYTSRASFFSEHGLFIISRPKEMLMVSDKGRNSFVTVEIHGDVLFLNSLRYVRKW